MENTHIGVLNLLDEPRSCPGDPRNRRRVTPPESVTVMGKDNTKSVVVLNDYLVLIFRSTASSIPGQTPTRGVFGWVVDATETADAGARCAVYSEE
jgi:hypothetical protein